MKVFVEESAGMHWTRRFVAYIIDSLLISLLGILLLSATGMEAAGDNLIPSFSFWVVFAVLSYIYFLMFEFGTSTTAGKGISSLGVYSLRGYQGNLEFGQVALRSISKINPLIVLLDVLIGWVSQGDSRQKALDKWQDTIVMTVGEEEYVPEAPKPAPVYVPKKEKTKETIHLKEGDIVTKQCPNCGTPYQLVYKGDGSLEVLGPWNYKCTWCDAYLGDQFLRYDEGGY